MYETKDLSTLVGPEGLGLHYFSDGYDKNVTSIITDCYNFETLIFYIVNFVGNDRFIMGSVF